MRDHLALSENAAAFLEEFRGIPVEITSQHAVTINGRIAFEFRQDGAVLYRKIFGFSPDGKRTGKIVREPSGTKTIMFNVDALNAASSSKILVVTEGEIDALSCMAAGAESVVSVPDGASRAERGDGDIDPADDTGFAWLWNADGTDLLEGFAQFEKIVLAVDADDKGLVLLDELAIRLGRTRCYVPKYPEGCKDANDALVRHGPAKLHEILHEARPLVPDRLMPIGDVPVQNYVMFDVGVEALKDKVNLAECTLGALLGPPGHGKTQLATNMIGEFVLANDAPAAFLALEDRAERIRFDLETIAMRRRAITNRIDARKLISDRVWFLGADENIDDEARDLDWLEHTIWEAAVRHGCKLIVIDPWNEIQHLYERQYTVAQYLNLALGRLAKLARRYGVALFIVAHPTKESGQIKSIYDWTLYALDGGAAWYNKLHYGLIVLRNADDDDETFIKVAKIKDHVRLGTPGIITTRFNRKSMNFEFIRNGGPLPPGSN